MGKLDHYYGVVTFRLLCTGRCNRNISLRWVLTSVRLQTGFGTNLSRGGSRSRRQGCLNMLLGRVNPFGDEVRPNSLYQGALGLGSHSALGERADVVL